VNLDIPSPFILKVCMVLGQAQTVHILLDTIPPEPDPKQHFFVFLGYPSTILHTACRKQFYAKPVVLMENQDSKDVPFASLESL